MRLRKSIILLLVGCLISLLLLSQLVCAKKWTIGISIPGAVEYFAAMQRGCDAAAEELDVELVYMFAEWDAEKQLTQVENFISRGVDLIIIIPADAIGAIPAVEKAKEAGIPIMALVNAVGLDAHSKYPGLISYIGQDEAYTGGLCGEMCLETLGKKGGNVLIIEGQPGTPCQINRTRGFLEKIGVNPQIKIIGIQAALGWDPEKAMRIMEDYLQTGVQIDFVFTHFDGMSLSALQAIEAAGKLGQIIVVGIDGTAAGLDAIREGKMYGDTWISPVTQGRVGVEMAVKYLQGETIPEFVPMNQIPVTLENVDEIVPEF
ncbi:MAG: sugar ABC transporter substrate-binding protein [candidate division WOR-3 bacterium]|nr:sugar ABC transporter substrate-binding protein [candidate division WOR-3 bacterium]